MTVKPDHVLIADSLRIEISRALETLSEKEKVLINIMELQVQRDVAGRDEQEIRSYTGTGKTNQGKGNQKIES